MKVAGRTSTGKTENESTDFPTELLIWLSPAFPIGSFAYSQGLERAIEDDLVSNEKSLISWLDGLLYRGALKTDVQILALSHQADGASLLTEINDLALALQPSRERFEETRIQGQAFWDAYMSAWSKDDARIAPPEAIALPVAVGVATRLNKISGQATLEAYAVAFLSNLVSAAIRLGAIGQFDGQRVLAKLMPSLRDVCREAQGATVDDIGSATFMADVASIQHETQETRLFRS